MNFTGTPIRILVCVLLAVYACSAKNVTIDAAFGYQDRSVYLFSNNEVMIVPTNGRRGSLMARTRFKIPEDMKLKAALGTRESRKILFYGDKYGLFFNSIPSVGVFIKNLKYGRKRQFLQNGGPDAASTIGDTHYVFKGCQMAIRYKWHTWGEPEDLRDYDLPCNIDAAWKLKNTTFFLRGDQMWTWTPNSTVEGPMPLSSMFNIGSWQLNPYENSVTESESL